MTFTVVSPYKPVRLPVSDCKQRHTHVLISRHAILQPGEVLSPLVVLFLAGTYTGCRYAGC